MQLIRALRKIFEKEQKKNRQQMTLKINKRRKNVALSLAGIREGLL